MTTRGWSVPDLGEITQLLIDRLTAAINATPQYAQLGFPFEVSGEMPEVARKDGKSVLTLYLLQVGRDPHWRNTPIQGSLAQGNASQPLGLTLSYLLTSYSKHNWGYEQLLMSIALSYFHTNPICISTNPTAEFTITIETDSIEAMSRLWQAITCPIRLSALFRAAVVFLDPATGPQPDSRTPAMVGLSVGADLNLAAPATQAGPQLMEVAVQRSMRVAPDASDPTQVTTLAGQQGAVAGDLMRVRGSGLDQPSAAAVYLGQQGTNNEWPLPPAWRVTGTSASGTASNADELVALWDADYGALPNPGTTLTQVPLPGNYLIKVGKPLTLDRSNAVPFSIAPLVVVPDGTNLPGTQLAANGTSYELTARGLVDGHTEVRIGERQLAVGPPLGQGVATVNAASGAISFQLPLSGLTSGSLLPVRVFVNNVEAPPAWWVLIP